jgi:outer membrane protein assembly factor BamB
MAPAVARDGTVYTASMAHFDPMVTYLIALSPDLTLKWASSMQHRLTDGCGGVLPIAPPGVTNLPNSCRYGATLGVDPTTNAKGSAVLSDEASSTPTVLPDGSVVVGVVDNYNYERGHLMHFDAWGNYINAFSFGWDSTPAVYRHEGTYSMVIKDNHYPAPGYCFFNNPVCAPIAGVYYVSQIDPNMQVEWSFKNTSTDRNHPYGFEWCVNAPVIDRRGIVYATSEDGHVYSIPQGHRGVFTRPRQKIFLLEALGAAYTPMSIGEDGKEYSQNDGHLFVVGR